MARAYRKPIRARAIAMWQKGKTYSQIAEVLGCSRSTARRWVLGEHGANPPYESLGFIDEKELAKWATVYPKERDEAPSAKADGEFSIEPWMLGAAFIVIVAIIGTALYFAVW